MIFSWIEKQKNRSIEWFFAHTKSGKVKPWLAFIAFIESIIFPIPTVAFLVPVLMAHREKWFSYAVLVTVFSVLGGIVGYFIGFFFFDAVGARIIEFYAFEDKFSQVQDAYNRSAFFVNFLGAFTPLPYKVFVLASGFLQANFIAFLLASIIGRSAQFFLIGYIMHLFGEKITQIFLRYFNIAVLILVGGLIIHFLL